MKSPIPLDRWQPLTVEQVRQTFAQAPFAWALAGGYAIELFLGQPIRAHGDIDVVVFRDDQLRVQTWLAAWRHYAADPPGSLRPWLAAEYLPFGIHDIWSHQANSPAWQLQLMLTETDGPQWFSRRNPLIRGPRADLFALYHNTPCIKVEVQLFYKAGHPRPKDDLDFQACLPRMDENARRWLSNNLALCFPAGHPWLHRLL